MNKLLLFFLTSFAVNAQFRENGAIEIKPTIGYSSSCIYSDTDPESLWTYLLLPINVLPSVNYGIEGDYYLNNRWSLRSGLQFLHMGGYPVFNDFFFSPVQNKLNYLGVPVNINWHFGSTRKWNLNAGITPSVLLSATENGRDIKNSINPFQLGINYGVGYKLEITENFSIITEYQTFYGLNDITKKENDKRINLSQSFRMGAVFYLH